MEHLHLLTVKTLPITNTRNSRVSIKSNRFRQSIIIPWDSNIQYNYGIAQKHLESLGFVIVGFSELGEGAFALLSSTFKPIK